MNAHLEWLFAVGLCFAVSFACVAWAVEEVEAVPEEPGQKWVWEAEEGAFEWEGISVEACVGDNPGGDTLHC